MKSSREIGTKATVYSALLTAMTFALTRLFQIPAANGYLHLGDSIIYITAFLLGGTAAGIAGGIGGALADLTSFPLYTVPTLVTKFIMGFVAGVIYKKKKNLLSMVLAFAAGSIIMLAGYYISECIIFGNMLSPLSSLPSNLLQAVFSVPLPVLLTPVLRKIK